MWKIIFYFLEYGGEKRKPYLHEDMLLLINGPRFEAHNNGSIQVKERVSVTEESFGPWRNTTRERAQREADRAPPHTSSQNETQEVIIILLQLARSERKCLFKKNPIIPREFVQTRFHACYRRVCWCINYFATRKHFPDKYSRQWNSHRQYPII